MPNTTTTPATSAQLTLGNFAMEKPPSWLVERACRSIYDTPWLTPRHFVTTEFTTPSPQHR